MAVQFDKLAAAAEGCDALVASGLLPAAASARSVAAKLPHSRVVTVKLDLATRAATLVKSFDQPEGLVAPAEGNAQTTRNGDLFVGWGACAVVTLWPRPLPRNFSRAVQLTCRAAQTTGRAQQPVPSEP